MTKLCLLGLSLATLTEVASAQDSNSITNGHDFATVTINFNDNGVQTCESTSDCLRPPFYICNLEKQLCQHKDIFPIYIPEFIGVMILPILLGMANVGGIGGGGIIIPTLMTAWGFETKGAIAISNITIFVGALLRFACTFQQKHPDKPHAVGLDYGIAIVMMPLVLVGSFSGVLINLWLPDVVLGIILTCLLVFLSIQSGISAIKIYKKESVLLAKGRETGKKTQEKLEKEDHHSYLADMRFADNDDVKIVKDAIKSSSESATASENGTIVSKQTSENGKIINQDNSSVEMTTPNNGTKFNKVQTIPFMSNSMVVYGQDAQENMTEQEIKQLDAILLAETKHMYQWRKHLFSFIVTFTALLVTFMRGSKKFDSIIGIQKCGYADWGLILLLVVIMFSLTALGLHVNKIEQNLKRKARKGMVASDIQFKGKQLFILCFFAFVGGWVSGALGLGGGSIFNPLMISLGVPPLVSTSTGMYMIMWSTFASSIIYISYGAMNLQFAAWLCFWACAGILSGIWAVNTLMKRYGRQSILVIVLVSVLVMATISVPIQTYADAIRAYSNGKDIWELQSIC